MISRLIAQSSIIYKPFMNFSSSQKVLKTPLYDFHVAKEGKIVTFAGYYLPVQYKNGGIIPEHHHTRKSATLFDVSHMGNIKIYGNDRIKFIESFTIGDIKELPSNHAVLSAITKEDGGIVDDTIITNMGEHISMIVNGACKHKDWAFMNKQLKEQFADKDVILDYNDQNALLALQGPKAAAVLQTLVDFDLKAMDFLEAVYYKIPKLNAECMISRCGYTGEDGFEIAVPNDKAIALAELLTSETLNENKPIVMPAGLGCRDTLRLECGLNLYGNDITEETTPIMVGVAWCIGKRRKAEGGFLGSEIILEQLKKGVEYKKTGFITEGAAARHEAEIYNKEGEKVGYVTSGTHSPCLKIPIGMGYIKNPYHKVGTELQVKIRDSFQKLTVAKLPFVKTSFYRKPAENKGK